MKWWLPKTKLILERSTLNFDAIANPVHLVGGLKATKHKQSGVRIAVIDYEWSGIYITWTPAQEQAPQRFQLQPIEDEWLDLRLDLVGARSGYSSTAAAKSFNPQLAASRS